MEKIDPLFRETHTCQIRTLNKEDQSVWTETSSFSKYLSELKELRAKDKEYHFACFARSNHDLLASFAVKGVIRENIQSAYIEIAKNKKDIGNLILVEILAAALDISFTELKLNRIELLILDSELQMKQVATQVAFRSEGKRKNAIVQNGKNQDANIFAISASEYDEKNVSRLLQAGVNLR